MNFIEKYIIHYQVRFLLDFSAFSLIQDIQSGDLLLLWTQLTDFLRAPDEFLTAKASLLYQKFLKKDAYRFIPFITQEKREQIAALLEEGMKEGAKPVSRDIFEDIMEETENLLIQRVFKGFSNSSFFVEYKEAVVLSTNL